jgi:hypothetical protein
MNMANNRLKDITCLGLMLSVGGGLLAQTTTGGFTGKVNDGKGVAMKGVLVRARSESLSLPRETRTDERGEWHLGLLPPGTYKLSFIKDGFYSRTVDLYLSVAKTEAVNLALKEVEVKSAIVEVVDALQTLEAKTEVKTSTNFSGEQLLALPGMTSFTSLLQYAPGVDSAGNLRGANQKTGVRYSVDGVDSRDDMAAYNSSTSVSMVQPILDSIQDLQVVQNSVNARNGRSLGSQYIMVTKRGGNEFSGSVRVYYGRDFWNSNSSDNTSATSKGDNLTTAQWSWTLSGPIIKDRLSFFIAGITTPTIRSMDYTMSWNSAYGTDVSKALTPLLTGNSLTDDVLVHGMDKTGYSLNVPTGTGTVPREQTDKQYDLRLTGALSADHTLDLKFSRRDRGLSNVMSAAGGATLVQDSGLLGNYRQKNSSYSLNYTGTFSSNTMVEASISRGFYEVGVDSNSLNGAGVPVLAGLQTTVDAQNLGSGYYYPSDWLGDNLSWGLPLNYAFGTYVNLLSSVNSPIQEKHQTTTLSLNLKTFIDAMGMHEIDAGVESYKMTYNPGTMFGQQNKVVYAGGWFANSKGDYRFPTVVYEGQYVNGQTFGALGPAPVLLEAWSKSVDQDNKTLALWLNDQWQISDHVNVNLGLRWNRYHMINGDGRTLGRAIAFEPRFLVRWDPKGNAEHLFTLSFTRNNLGFSSGVAASLATNPMNSYTLRGWTGAATQPGQPSISSLEGTDNGQYGVRFVSYAELTNSDNYSNTPYYFVNQGDTVRLNDLRTPYADQWELGYTHNLSDSTSVRIGLVDKRFYRELMAWSDYTWNDLALSVDPSGRSGGRPTWLPVTNYGSSHKPRIYQSAEIAIDHKLTSRLSWNLAWSYFYEYNYDEQGRLNYATVKAAQATIPSSAYLADGVDRRNHRVTSIMSYVQPLGNGSLVYTLSGKYEPVNPSYLMANYSLTGMSAGSFLNQADKVHNPNGYDISLGNTAPVLPIYYATPGNWKNGHDAFDIGFSISWNIPLNYKKVMFVGTASVSDLLHHVYPGGGYGSLCPTNTALSGSSTTTDRYLPNGRVVGDFTGAGIESGLGWGSSTPLAYYQGMTNSTRPVTNVSAGIRF